MYITFKANYFAARIHILFCVLLHCTAQENPNTADPEHWNYRLYILTGAESTSRGNASVPQAKKRGFSGTKTEDNTSQLVRGRAGQKAKGGTLTPTEFPIKIINFFLKLSLKLFVTQLNRQWEQFMQRRGDALIFPLFLSFIVGQPPETLPSLPQPMKMHNIILPLFFSSFEGHWLSSSF